jgi:VanZ family protein
VKKTFIISMIMAWVLVAGMIAVIVSFSSRQGGESVEMSGRIIDYIINKLKLTDVLEYNEWLMENRNYIFRKALHFTEYGILAMLTFNALSMLGFKRLKVSIISLVLALCVALFDEYYQSRIPGRHPQILDIIIDFAGALVFVAISLIIFSIVNKRKGLARATNKF